MVPSSSILPDLLGEQFFAEDWVVERRPRRDEDGSCGRIISGRRCFPVEREVTVVGLRPGNVNVLEMLLQAGKNPGTRRTATTAHNAFGGIFRRFIRQIHFFIISEGDSRLQQQHAPAAARHERDRLRWPVQMVQRTIAIDDVKLPPHFSRGIEIEMCCFDGGMAKPLLQNFKVFLSPVGRDDGATAVQEEAGVVANSGRYFQHTATRDRQTEAGKVLEATMIVPQINPRVKCCGWSQVKLANAREAGHAKHVSRNRTKRFGNSRHHHSGACILSSSFPLPSDENGAGFGDTAKVTSS